MQEYMFDIEHIPGVKNIIADGFSRFCAFPTRDSDQQESSKEQDTFLAPILDGYKLDSETYKRISSVHNSMVGHFGVEKTYGRCKSCKERWGVWDHMREDIKFFRKHNCSCCQKMNVLQIQFIPIHSQPQHTQLWKE